MEKMAQFSNVSLLEQNLFCHLTPWDRSSNTECMLNPVTECEVCLTFNGNNLHEYIHGRTHFCFFFTLC